MKSLRFILLITGLLGFAAGIYSLFGGDTNNAFWGFLFGACLLFGAYQEKKQADRSKIKC